MSTPVWHLVQIGLQFNRPKTHLERGFRTQTGLTDRRVRRFARWGTETRGGPRDAEAHSERRAGTQGAMSRAPRCDGPGHRRHALILATTATVTRRMIRTSELELLLGVAGELKIAGETAANLVRAAGG